ncbi:hypothetical protein CRUP_036481 [Coryphaenoides rupestris]|nr:hypothetical protein CRUP_036481 [Coryphaenoides rupestris]
MVLEETGEVRADVWSAGSYLLLGLDQRLQVVFDHRMRAWQRLQDGQLLLQKKKEAESKLHANKSDKLQQTREDIRELEAKVHQGERDFEQISKTIRKELDRFEVHLAGRLSGHHVLAHSSVQLLGVLAWFAPDRRTR